VAGNAAHAEENTHEGFIGKIKKSTPTLVWWPNKMGRNTQAIESEIVPGYVVSGPTAPLPKESPQAYTAFLAYKSLGDQRSYEKTAKVIQKSLTLTKRWGSKFRWQERIRSWVAQLEHDRSQIVADRMNEMVERQLGLATAMQLRVVERLTRLKASELTPSDLVKMATLAVILERTALGIKAGFSMKAVEQIELTRPEGNIILDSVRDLSQVDRGLLRDLSIKYMKIIRLEAEVLAEEKQQKQLPLAVG
jgi:hypothetical protein